LDSLVNRIPLRDYDKHNAEYNEIYDVLAGASAKANGAGTRRDNKRQVALVWLVLTAEGIGRMKGRWIVG
jgi:hypothetical protein